MPQKGTCFGKLTNITFAYLLSPTILKHFKIIFIQGCIILAQIVSKLPIFLKRYFQGKLTITFVCLLNSILLQRLKKNLRERIIRQGYIVLVQIGIKFPCPPKENLSEKLTNIALVFYIPSCYIISKKSWESR